MLNISPVGRNCSQEERDAFEVYDKVRCVDGDRKGGVGEVGKRKAGRKRERESQEEEGRTRARGCLMYPFLQSMRATKIRERRHR